jgi:hypothetical protein
LAADFGRHGHRSIGLDVGHDDAGTSLREGVRAPAPDAAPRPGDHRYGTGQLDAHLPPPLNRSPAVHPDREAMHHSFG